VKATSIGVAFFLELRAVLSLEDVPALTWCEQRDGKEPDWRLILVISDYLEDQGDLKTSNTLRWLYRWNHWPQRSFINSQFFWYCRNPDYRNYCLYCRYCDGFSRKDSGNFRDTWRMAILPLMFNTSFETAGHQPFLEGKFKTISESIDFFAKLLPTPYFDPQPAKLFRDVLPRKVEDLV
jgi:hypothetical protein